MQNKRWLHNTICNRTVTIYLPQMVRKNKQHQYNLPSPSQNSSRLAIIFSPSSPILHDNPFPLHRPRRHPRIRLISNTPTISPLRTLRLKISLTGPRRCPIHIPISWHHLHTPPLRPGIQPHPLPLPLNIHFVPTPTAPPTALRITHTYTRPTSPRTTPPLLHLHQLDSRRRRRRRRGADDRRADARCLHILRRTGRGVFADYRFGHDSTATFTGAVREDDVFFPRRSSCGT